MTVFDGRSDGSAVLDAVLANLVDRAPDRASRPIPGPAPAPTYDGLHEAAAVLGWYDPERLRPTRPATDRDRQLLITNSITVLDDRRERRLCLAGGVRVAVLRQLRSDSGTAAALKANLPEPADTVGLTLRDQLTGRTPDIATLDLTALQTAARVARWLDEAGFPTVDRGAIARRTAWLNLLLPFEHLAGEHFVGRQTELTRLREFVGVLPPVGADGTPWAPPPPVPMARSRWLEISGPGGVGKSTLLSRFILEHARALETDRFPFAYLDFDRADIDAAEPLTLLIEAVRQLAIEYPELDRRTERLRAEWQSLLTRPSRPSYESRTEGAGDFGRIVSSVAPGRPVLFVLDTFEEVQWRSAEYVRRILMLTEELGTYIRTLRIVVAGRGGVDPTELGLQNRIEPLRLSGLDPASAVALLRSRGVDPASAATIAAEVGGDPQNLQLAARDWTAVPRTGPDAMTAFLAELNRGMIRGKLHERVLDHIHDDDVRRLAHPGLVLRRLTPELILAVLAEPCQLSIRTVAEATHLFGELRRETALVKPDGARAVIHLPELRRSTLPLLEADEPGLAEQIHRGAVRFYELRRPDPVERAEELYHRLKLGQGPEALLARWLPGVEGPLITAVDEFDGERHAFLAAQLGLSVSDRVLAAARQPDWERLVAARVRPLLADARAYAAMQLLGARTERLVGSELVDLEAEALARLGGNWEVVGLLTGQADRALAATDPESAYRLLRLLVEAMVSYAHWAWSSDVLPRLERLTTSTGSASHRLLQLAAERAIWHADPPRARDIDQERASVFGAALDDLTEADLRADRSLAALAGLQLRGPGDLVRIRRVLEAIGFSRRDEPALRLLGARLAEFDRDTAEGRLLMRYGGLAKKTGTQSWAELLQSSVGESAIFGLLDQYGSQLPAPVIEALAGTFVGELTPWGWYPAVDGPSPSTGPGDTPSQEQPSVPDPSSAVLRVTDEVSRQVAVALAGCLTAESLRSLSRDRLRVSIDSLVDSTAPVSVVAGVAVDYFNSLGRVPELIARARELAPHDRGLIAAADAVGLPTLAGGDAAAVEEAVARYRGLADRNPALAPDLAVSLTNLSVLRAERGDRTGALAAGEEAVAAYRALAEADPVAFGPDLARSEDNLSDLRSAEAYASATDRRLGRLGEIEARVCRVEGVSSGRVYGTGFLVGIEVALTAAHVLASDDLVQLRFDSTALHDGSMVIHGTVHPVVKVLHRDDELDFALLQLEGSPGVEPVGGPGAAGPPRGWLDLGESSGAGRSTEAPGSITVVGYPDGGVLSRASGAHVRVDGHRIEHSAPANVGLSGAPIFDPALDLVGMQIGAVQRGPHETGAFGVTTAAIRARLADYGLDSPTRDMLA